ncbi:hypothetical protein FQZ97_885690 [compost metagenome]
MLIGNSHTFVRHGLMVTPRGYANKYDLDEGGSTREGEKAGRSLSSGLLGWMAQLRADHAEGIGVATLAQQHGLPPDYIEAVLSAAVDEPGTMTPTEETEG